MTATASNTTTTRTWTTSFPPLSIELLPNGNLRLEDPTEHIERRTAIIDVHLVQLRVMAERLGMLREVSASDAALLQSEREHAQRQRAEIDSLKRRLLRIRDSAVSLQDNFRKDAPWDDADLAGEMWQINNVVALLDQAVDDFQDDYKYAEHTAATEPSAPPTKARAAAPIVAPSFPGGRPAPAAQGDLLGAAL